MSEVEEFVAALRVIGSGRAFVSRDEVLWRRIQSLYDVLGGTGDGDEAVIIRALAQMATVREASIAKAARTNRRKKDALAAKAATLRGQGYRDRYIAEQVDRSVSTVRRWHQKAR
jgi:hypothetical protein